MSTAEHSQRPGLGTCAVSFFLTLTQAGLIWEEGVSNEEMPPLDWPVGKPVVSNGEMPPSEWPVQVCGTFSSLMIDIRGPLGQWSWVG